MRREGASKKAITAPASPEVAFKKGEYVAYLDKDAVV
jgi:hypothetical protein